MGMWQVNDAKNKFSELIEQANANGPQVITRHGSERAVVISIDEYRALTAHKPDLKSYLLGGPKVDDLVIDRDQSLGRTIDFNE
jgi:prevent-host-death family protein